MSVLSRTTPFDTKFYLLALVKAVVSANQLGLYAQGAAEVAFLASNNLTTAQNPLFRAQAEGYDTGNRLLGLLCVY